MMKRLFISLLTVTTLFGVVGCTNPVKEQNITEKVVMQKEEKISDKYLEQVSIISGRLDGMNQAIVQGLTETLDTARLSREMAEEALAIAQENQKLLKELQQQINEAEAGGEGGDVEGFEGGGDF